MKPTAVTTAAVLLAAVALLLAGCGGGGSSSSTGTSGNSPSTREPAGTNPGGPIKKATAPNAPAGSKVTSCGGAGPKASGLRAVAVDCAAAKATMARWQGKAACTPAVGPRSPASDESRKSCSLGRWRCQAVLAGRGTSVSCARPAGGNVDFLEKP
jgi:hypothetical protein